MPTYLFIHPDTEEAKEVFQRISEDHVYIDEKGIEWKRVYTPINCSIDGASSEMNEQQYIEKTKNMKGTVGDLWDMSREQSEKRKQKHGYDPVQRKWFKDYSEKRQGKKHPNDPNK